MAETVSVIVGAEDRARLAAVVGDRNRLQKHVQRARIVLLSAERLPVLRSPPRSGSAGLRCGTGSSGSPKPGWTVCCATRRASRASRGCPRRRWRRYWRCRARRHRGRRPTGPAARSPGRRASPCARCSGSGGAPTAAASHPHLQEVRRPAFVSKVEDIVGLYVEPPRHAVVLSIDEKSRIQALDRTQPGLPLKPGRCGTMTHDYKRNGTTSMFAALNVLEGKVVGRCMPQHRHQEFIFFLTRSNGRCRPAR